MTLPKNTGTRNAGVWADLGVRILSAVVIVAIAGCAVWLGGAWFRGFVALVCGAMVWELARMLDTDVRSRAVGLGLISGIAVFVSGLVPNLALPLLVAPSIVGFSQMGHRRWIFALYAAGVLLAGFGLLGLREEFGIVWIIWLLLVVVVVDVLGYFAGRMLGGPKFWPRVSPKKTWSGTIAGWIGAAAVGYGFMLFASGGYALIFVSVALAFASQLGDIAESAIKRQVGVKDSSHLIPGHGGVLDRFDGMLGAALLFLVVEQIMAFPPVST